MPNVSMIGQGAPQGSVTPPMFSSGGGGGMMPTMGGGGAPGGSGLDLQSMIALLSMLNRRPAQQTAGAPVGGAQPQQNSLMSLLSGLKQGGGATPRGGQVQTP